MIKSQITDSVISKASLSPQEAMVIKVWADTESAGGPRSRTREFVRSLTERRHRLLFNSAEKKIKSILH